MRRQAPQTHGNTTLDLEGSSRNYWKHLFQHPQHRCLGLHISPPHALQDNLWITKYTEGVAFTSVYLQLSVRVTKAGKRCQLAQVQGGNPQSHQPPFAKLTSPTVIRCTTSIACKDQTFSTEQPPLHQFIKGVLDDVKVLQSLQLRKAFPPSKLIGRQLFFFEL